MLTVPPIASAFFSAVVFFWAVSGVLMTLVESSTRVRYWKTMAGFLRNSSRSFNSSVAVTNRSLGSSAMHFMMICSMPTGILGFRLLGMGAPPLMCLMATATGDSPS